MAFNRARMKQLREQRGMNLSQLAKLSTVPRSVLIDIENGKTKDPSFKTTELIAMCLKVNIETFKI